jgi:glycosyltransferase involved in cell wall biosynthesis
MLYAFQLKGDAGVSIAADKSEPTTLLRESQNWPDLSTPLPSETDSRSARRHVVAMVCDAVLPYSQGGREYRYRELTRRLAEQADVHMYTMKWWDGPRVRIENDITFHAISRLVPMYVEQRRSLRQALVFGISCIRLLYQRFDVLEADNIPFVQVFILRLITFLKRRRFVVTWHEVWGKEYWCEYLGRIGVLAYFVEKLAMHLPDHILAASPQTADRLRAVVGPWKSISLAIHGIDLDEVLAVSPSTESCDITVVGRLMDHKRVDMLLEAVALLHADGIPVTCRVIGNGPERDALHERATVLAISPYVDFRHDIGEQKDVYALLKASRVCVFPSAREGFGVAVVEALACGVPVVTTSAPDNLSQHIVARSERGTVCEPSARGIAEAVRDALVGRDMADGPLIPESWLSEYSWDAIAGQVSAALFV